MAHRVTCPISCLAPMSVSCPRHHPDCNYISIPSPERLCGLWSYCLLIISSFITWYWCNYSRDNVDHPPQGTGGLTICAEWHLMVSLMAGNRTWLWMTFDALRPGQWFNIKMSYQYMKSHCGDKTILRPSYLHNGISYTGKMASLYWIRALNEYGSIFLNEIVYSLFQILLKLIPRVAVINRSLLV